MLKCECCGRLTDNLFQVKRKVITQSICLICKREEEDMKNINSNWKKGRYPVGIGKSIQSEHSDPNYKNYK